MRAQLKVAQAPESDAGLGRARMDKATRAQLGVAAGDFVEVFGKRPTLAKGPAGSWTAKGPHVLTWELEKLVKWLDAAPSETSSSDRFRFTEPYLAFELRRQSEGFLELRALFTSWFRPPWNDGTTGPEVLTLKIAPSRFHEAARDLGAQLQRFPPR